MEKEITESTEKLALIKNNRKGTVKNVKEIREEFKLLVETFYNLWMQAKQFIDEIEMQIFEESI